MTTPLRAAFTALDWPHKFEGVTGGPTEHVLADTDELERFTRAMEADDWELWFGKHVIRAVYRDPTGEGMMTW